MFRFLRIAAGIAIVAGFAMLPFLRSGSEAASLSSNTTVSAIGISPQDDNVRIVGISSGRVFATTAGAPLLAEVTPVSTRRFIGRAIIDPQDVKTAYVTLFGYGVPDRSAHLETTNHSFTPARRPLRNWFPERLTLWLRTASGGECGKRRFVSTPVTKFAPLGPLATAGGS